MSDFIPEAKCGVFSELRTNARRRIQKRVAKHKNETERNKFSIGTDDLMTTWNLQQGRCAICGMQMDLHGLAHKKSFPKHFAASIDRMNSQIGYTPENIALVHFCCNSFKGDLSLNETYAVAKLIVAHFQKTYVGTDVDIEPDLKSSDSGKLYFHYPKYKFVSSGKQEDRTAAINVHGAASVSQNSPD